MLGTRNMSTLINVNLNIIKQPDLCQTFATPEENYERMQDYFFPSFAQELLSVLFNNVKEGDRRTFLITGRPGFGKTHLLLFVANFFRAGEKEPVMEQISQITGDFPARAMKSKLGRFLVVTPLPPQRDKAVSFESNLISALNGALARENINFIPKAIGTPQEIYDQTVEFLKSTEEWKGIMVVMDNVEPIIESIEQGIRAPLYEEVFKFFSYVKETREYPVFFVGAGSFFPNNYISPALEQETIQEVGRHFDGYMWLDYNNHDWINFVTNKILQHDSMSALDILVTNQEFTKLASFTHESGIFKGEDEAYIRDELLPKSFPLHPMTMMFLPKLSQKICKQEKNLLAFFRDTSPGSFRYYLDTFGIFQASGKLSVYTPDFLFSYYEQTLKESKPLRNVYEAVERAYMLSGNLPLARRVIRLVALMQMIGDDTVKPTRRNILESLYVTSRDAKQFEPMIIEMIQKGGFLYDRRTEELTLPIEKVSVNLNDYISRQLMRIQRDYSYKDELNRKFRIREQPAKNYNENHKTDRQILSQYVDINDIRAGNESINGVLSKLGRQKDRYRGDMAILYFVTADDDEMVEVRGRLEKAPWDHPQIAVAVPVRPMNFFELLIEQTALDSIRQSEPPFNNAESEERKVLEERFADNAVQLKEKVEFARRPDRLYWFHQGKEIRRLQDQTIEENADYLMEENFPQTPVVPLSLVSSFKDKKKYREIRKIAVEKLLAGGDSFRLPQSPRSQPDQLISNLLVKYGILTPVSENDSFVQYGVAHHVDQDSPVKEIWNGMYRNLTQTGSGRRIVQIENVLSPFLKMPYGVCPSLLEILLAGLFRNYISQMDIFANFREMKKTGDHTHLTKACLNYETVRGMVMEPDNYIVYMSEFPSEEKLFVNKIVEIFARKRARESDAPLWGDGRDAIYNWYKNLPLLTKKNRVFKFGLSRGFMDMLEGKGKNAVPRDFFREVLPEFMGYKLSEFSYKDKALEMLENIKNIYIELTRYTQLKEIALWKSIQAVFTSDETADFDSVFEKWVKGVPWDVDRNRLSPLARNLLEIDTSLELKEQFLEKIADNMGLSPFSQWEQDRSLEYLARISSAKLEVDIADVVMAFTLPDTKEPKEQMARESFDRIFKKLGISPSEQEVIVVELLEKMVWEEQ